LTDTGLVLAIIVLVAATIAAFCLIVRDDSKQ